jgi:hypothetical protein
MIPYNELRIGNFVLAEQTMQRISMIDDISSETTALPGAKEEEAKTRTRHLLESLQPVPLNDSILKRCNFVYHDYFKFWQLITGAEDNRSEMDIDRDYNIIDFMRKPVVKKVASLHQLQNIYFMLKGKELLFWETEAVYH